MISFDLFIILCTLVHCPTLVYSLRKTHNSQSTKSAKKECQFQCGQGEINMLMTDEVRGDKIEYDIKFVPGQGSGVKFTNTNEVCLTDCLAYSYRSADRTKGESCSSLNKNSRKVSKATSQNTDFKLCCVTQKCKYEPNFGNYSVGSTSSYKELKSLAGKKFLQPRSCVCCNKNKNEVPWGTELKTVCKLAYEPSTIPLFGYKVLAVTTLTLSDKIKKGSCSKYCKQYAGQGYPFGKYTKKKRNLAVADREFVASLPSDVANVMDSFDYSSARQKLPLIFLSYFLKVAVIGFNG